MSDSTHMVKVTINRVPDGDGDEFTVDWIFTARDGRKYYLTPWWTRVLVDDTERVRDAA